MDHSTPRTLRLPSPRDQAVLPTLKPFSPKLKELGRRRCKGDPRKEDCGRAQDRGYSRQRRRGRVGTVTVQWLAWYREVEDTGTLRGDKDTCREPVGFRARDHNQRRGTQERPASGKGHLEQRRQDPSGPWWMNGWIGVLGISPAACCSLDTGPKRLFYGGSVFLQNTTSGMLPRPPKF